MTDTKKEVKTDMPVDIAQAIHAFMMRVNLNAQEIPAWTKVMEFIQTKLPAQSNQEE